MEKKECSKVKFSSEKFADEYIEKIKKTSKREKKPTRSYFCKNCISWHLTSAQPKSVGAITQELKKERELVLQLTAKIDRINKERNSLVEKNKEKDKQIESAKVYAENLKLSMQGNNKRHIEKIEKQLADYKNRVEFMRTKEFITNQFFSFLSLQSNSLEVLKGIKDYVEKKIENFDVVKV